VVFLFNAKPQWYPRRIKNTWLKDWTDVSIMFDPCAFTQTCFHQSSGLELESKGSAKNVWGHLIGWDI